MVSSQSFAGYENKLNASSTDTLLGSMTASTTISQPAGVTGSKRNSFNSSMCSKVSSTTGNSALPKFSSNTTAAGNHTSDFHFRTLLRYIRSGANENFNEKVNSKSRFKELNKKNVYNFLRIIKKQVLNSLYLTL